MAGCPSCGAANPDGKRFCGDCGSPLAAGCPSCGSENPPGNKFCGDCGAALTPSAPSAPAVQPTAVEPGASDSELRLVSVLFADLVGFTTLSEVRDSEEVRELLTRYFDTCRRLIERYGGTVEKFIGDAVMAVWGAPVAQEDDAERAVRAALDLVQAVSELGEEVTAPGLRARAGVLTGEAAVMPGSHEQGIVVGDLVNSASRVQSAAEPGTVLVGESTKRATEASIAYKDVGLRELKGKTEPVPLFRALRVTAGRAGALRPGGLEAPFVGRERDMRVVKELFHASAQDGKAQLVLVSGIAGIGKSRLSWEFEKYVDGLPVEVWWHRGRNLSYGEGVAYWALAEMVKMRCGIAEDEDPSSALGKLRTTLETHLEDEGERRWVEPRLAHLLGLEEGAPGDQENLFAAWRILFERLAEQGPTVLVFEDMQWADAGLLDFLEYLLEWSRNHPVFVLALARPELGENRASWGAGKRGFTSLYLEPLSRQAMEELLAGLVPGLSDDVRGQILERAEGIPLYAVETVRMLLDRGLLEREGSVYRPTGPIDTLEVPETLHSLIAARLDGLAAQERRLVQDGSVLGKTFTKQGLVAVTGQAEEQLEQLLASLLRKEVLAIQADPRSPERGQYAFLQDIVRRVAYETLSKRERKAKHLAAARFLASTPGAGEDEIAEVVAAHYLDCYAAAPDDPDAEELRGRARDMMVRAGERAASLGASAEAQRSFERAIELTDDPLRQAELHERAGVMAYDGARADDAASHFERAMELFDAHGASHPAARVSARMAEIMWDRGRIENGLDIMNRAFAVLSEEEGDADLAALAAQLGRFMFFAGQHDVALDRIDTALNLAEALMLPDVLAQALNTKGTILHSHNRKTEGLALLRTALSVALENDRPSAALRAYYNVADMVSQSDRYQEAAELVRKGLELARRVGNRYWEWGFVGHAYSLYSLGEWDEVLAAQAELPAEDWSQARLPFATLLTSIVLVKLNRGLVDDAERDVRAFGELGASADLQERAQYGFAEAAVLLVRGDPARALAAAEEAIATRESNGISFEAVKEAFLVSVEAALALGEVGKADELLARVDALAPGRCPQFLRAHVSRFRARLGSDNADDLFKGAAGLFRELAHPFHLAVTECEHGEWLVAQGRGEDARSLLAEASEIFERLDARPWIDRLHALEASSPAEVPA
jgi:class 3 adenylate cyclase/tetratricopeptide (TPR) repeat protein